MWRLFEPYHAVVYFDPDVTSLRVEAGLKGYWMGYFATRAAPLGPVPAEVVSAAFFGFAPAMVARAIPAAWSVLTPGQAWSLRLRIADTALHRHLAHVDTPDIQRAAELALTVVDDLDVAGRTLAAATARAPVPREPHLALWHACTVLREHRGDGHVAALVANAVAPLEAQALAAQAGLTPAELVIAHRGWTLDQWHLALAAASARPAGFRDHLEALTEVAAAAPWRRARPELVAELHALLTVLVERIVSGGGVPYPNLMGVPR